jgi:hypothetical protein
MNTSRGSRQTHWTQLWMVTHNGKALGMTEKVFAGVILSREDNASPARTEGSLKFGGAQSDVRSLASLEMTEKAIGDAIIDGRLASRRRTDCCSWIYRPPRHCAEDSHLRRRVRTDCIRCSPGARRASVDHAGRRGDGRRPPLQIFPETYCLGNRKSLQKDLWSFFRRPIAV